MHLRTTAIGMAVTVGLLVGACGDDDDGAGATGPSVPASTSSTAVATTTQEPAEGCTEERRGGEVTFGVNVFTRGLDRTVALGSGYAGGIELAAIYDNLLSYDPETGEFEPHVAESFSSNAARDEWTITLRDGVRFGNGDPLTTEAVRYSFERMAAASVSSAAYAAEVEEYLIQDDRTMTFRLKAPNGGFAYALAEDAGAIVNPNVVEARGADAFNLDPRGAGVGPYEVERFAPDEELVLVARDDYWGGPVCIERLRFVYVPGGRATYEAFEHDELQMALLVEGAAVDAALADGTEGYVSIASAATILFLNQGVGGYTGPLQDVRVRRAITQAIDPQVANQRGEQGFLLPGPEVISDEAPYSPGVEGVGHDPDAARALVATLKADGVWDGAFTLTAGNTPTAVDTSIALEAMFEAVGMTVTVETLPTGEASTKILTRQDFEVGLNGASIQEESAYARLNQFECGNVRTRTGYCDPRMDAALEDLKLASTRAERVAALAAVQEVWNDTLPSYVLFHRREMVAWKDGIRGVKVSRDVTPVFHDAWIER